jgi:hypothetical protein
MYPADWPRCDCGDFCLDGHLTCGRAECSESDARDRRAGLRDREGANPLAIREDDE